MILKIPKVSISTIFVIIPILYFNSCTFEFIKNFSFVLPIVIACVLLWLLLLSREKVVIDIHNILPMGIFVLILGVLFLLGTQNQVSVLLTDLTNAIYLLFFMFVFAIYSGKHYKNDRGLILFVCITDAIISCVYSIYRLIEDPNLSRLLSTGSYHETYEAIEARGVVSFGVVYGLVLILLVLFFLILQKKKHRISNILLFSLFTVTLFFAQFMIAILLVGIGIIWILIINNDNKKNKTRFFFFIIAGVICIFILPVLLVIIVENNILGYEINARLEEILGLFRGESLEGTDLLARFSQYFMSLSAFISSYGMGKIAMNSVEVGGHSQWLDGFGNYGIIFILYIVALFTFRKFVIKKLPNKNAKRVYQVVFAIYIIMSLINTSAWAPITLNLYVIIPFLCLEKISE